MRTAATPLLDVRGISKRFGGHQALREVSLELAAAEAHAVAGENGAGKSTLLQVLSGALRPDGGTLLWEGRPAVFGDVRAAQALGISMVHQEPQLIPSLSVEENIAVGRLPSRLGPVRLVDRRALRAQAEDALEPLGAPVAPGALVAGLSVAERQLVAIARALRLGARLIILDEPTSSLSLAEIERLFAALKALRQRGTTLVYVSHRLEELGTIADRVTVLRDGQVVVTAPMAAMSHDALIEAMSGRDRALPPAPGSGSAAGEVALEVLGLRPWGRTHDVTLEVRSGEIVGLAGLVGAGRSRTLRAIFGAEPVSGGVVRVRGEDGVLATVATLRGALAAGLGFVPEDRRSQGLVMTASVAENIGIVAPAGTRRLGFLRRGVLRSAARRAVEALRIKARGLDDPVRVLSGGNQQKVVLGRWMGCRRVLLLDEPTRGVDVTAKVEIHRHLKRLAGEGLALLVVSSELPELLSLCDRIHVMREGRLVAEIPRDRATQAEILRLAMGAR